MPTAPRWRPLSQRHLPPQDEVLVEDVPAYLGMALSRWVVRYVGLYWIREIALQLHIAWDWTDDPLTDGLDPDRPARVFCTHVTNSNPEQLLDVIDCFLHRTMSKARTEKDRVAAGRLTDTAVALETILSNGGSAWRVTNASDGLERRVDQTVQDDYRLAIDAAVASGVPSAAEHLRSSWEAAYGRNPGPAAAYGDGVKAVESAAIPVISPTNKGATLGTMIADLKNKPAKWQFALSDKNGAHDIEPVIALMERLWQGQVRHGANPTPKVTAEEGEAALHAAVTLVHWFTSGAVTTT